MNFIKTKLYGVIQVILSLLLVFAIFNSVFFIFEKGETWGRIFYPMPPLVLTETELQIDKQSADLEKSVDELYQKAINDASFALDYFKSVKQLKEFPQNKQLEELRESRRAHAKKLIDRDRKIFLLQLFFAAIIGLLALMLGLYIPISAISNGLIVGSTLAWIVSYIVLLRIRGLPPRYPILSSGMSTLLQVLLIIFASITFLIACYYLFKRQRLWSLIYFILTIATAFLATFSILLLTQMYIYPKPVLKWPQEAIQTEKELDEKFELQEKLLLRDDEEAAKDYLEAEKKKQDLQKKLMAIDKEHMAQYKQMDYNYGRNVFPIYAIICLIVLIVGIFIPIPFLSYGLILSSLIVMLLLAYVLWID